MKIDKHLLTKVKRYVPLLLLMAHLQAYYGYAGMEPGRRALVKVALDDGWRGAQDADLSAGPELTSSRRPGNGLRPRGSESRP